MRCGCLSVHFGFVHIPPSSLCIYYANKICRTCCFDCFFFFFQAEDGIRDLVRSRGLGDVYKRQELHEDKKVPFINFNIESSALVDDLASGFDEIEYDVSNNLGQARKLLLEVSEFYSHKSIVGDDLTAVSYTHLTLPTSDLV